MSDDIARQIADYTDEIELVQGRLMALRQMQRFNELVQESARGDNSYPDLSSYIDRMISLSERVLDEDIASREALARGDKSGRAEMRSDQEPREEKGEEDGAEPVEMKSAGAHTLYR